MRGAKHTRGPWAVDTHRGVMSLHTRTSVCDVYSGACDTLAEADANQRLIAAAPDLLEALQDLKAQVDTFCAQFGEADFETGRAATVIAKATGTAA